MERYRICDCQKVYVNGKPIVIFSAYEFNEDMDGYIFIGKYSAPHKTPTKKLQDYINTEGE
jgi:hypothetical protein